MFEICVNYKDYDFVVVVEEFDYQPEERQTYWHPGCPEEIIPTDGYVECDGLVPENEADYAVIRWTLTEGAFEEIIEHVDYDRISDAYHDYIESLNPYA